MKHILTPDELREEIERNVREWLRRGAKPEDLNCYVYDCDGRKRFIVYGTVPATPHKADKLFQRLSKIFGLNEKRGPKRPQITLESMRRAAKKLSPHANIGHLAESLSESLGVEVKPRQIPSLLRKMFREEQAARRDAESQLEDTSLDDESFG